MLPLANAQTTHASMGVTGFIMLGSATSAPMGKGNLDVTDMMYIKAVTRGMNENGLHASSSPRTPSPSLCQTAPHQALMG